MPRTPVAAGSVACARQYEVARLRVISRNPRLGMAAERVEPGTGGGGDATIADCRAASAAVTVDHRHGHSCCTGTGRSEPLKIRFSVLVVDPSDQHYGPG